MVFENFEKTNKKYSQTKAENVVLDEKNILLIVFVLP